MMALYCCCYTFFFYLFTFVIMTLMMVKYILPCILSFPNDEKGNKEISFPLYFCVCSQHENQMQRAMNRNGLHQQHYCYYKICFQQHNTFLLSIHSSPSFFFFFYFVFVSPSSPPPRLPSKIVHLLPKFGWHLLPVRITAPTSTSFQLIHASILSFQEYFCTPTSSFFSSVTLEVSEDFQFRSKARTSTSSFPRFESGSEEGAWRQSNPRRHIVRKRQRKILFFRTRKSIWLFLLPLSIPFSVHLFSFHLLFSFFLPFDF